MRMMRMRAEVKAMGLSARLRLAVAVYLAPRDGAPTPTAAEVAARFGVGEEAIRQRVKRARRLARQVHPNALPPKPRGKVRVFATPLSAVGAFADSL